MFPPERARLAVKLNEYELPSAMNEAVIITSRPAKISQFKIYVDGKFMEDFRADGVVVATPTGSTAYALSSAGPILHPQLQGIVLVPIAPHLSVDRAVVLAEGSMVSIRIKGDNGVLSIDGQPSITLMDDDHVDVRAAEVTTQFVRFGDPGYFYRNLTAHMNENSLGLPR